MALDRQLASGRAEAVREELKNIKDERKFLHGYVWPRPGAHAAAIAARVARDLRRAGRGLFGPIWLPSFSARHGPGDMSSCVQ